ncbi:MAG: restriction endonuclease subunit S [Muribaculum sp.]|nr:restriction endonuclease subunit S [Muribaculum sp.]
MNDYQLSEICKVITDGDHAAPPKADEGVPFITIRNFDGCNSIDFTNCMFVPKDYYDNLKPSRKARQNDIIYSVVGSFGIPILIKDEKPFVFQRHIALLRPNIAKVNPTYLYHLMRSSSFYAVADVLAVGSAQRTITLTALRRTKISLPDLSVQNSIGKILSDYDKLIETNRKRIAILEEMAMRTYQEWFVHFRFPGHESSEFVDGLPYGWKYRQLEEIIQFDRGCSYTSEEIDVTEGVYLINLKNIKAYGGYNYDGLKVFGGNYKARHIVKKGDLVMGVTDMTQDRRTVGAVALIPEYSDTAIISTDLVKIQSKLPNIFLYAMFRFGGYSKFISEFANGSNVLHLKPDAIRKQLLPIPSHEIIMQFDDVISPIVDEMEVLTYQNSLVQQMRDRLLPQLMSGQLEVTP